VFIRCEHRGFGLRSSTPSTSTIYTSVKSPFLTYCCEVVAVMTSLIFMTSQTVKCNDCHEVMENSKFEFRAMIKLAVARCILRCFSLCFFLMATKQQNILHNLEDHTTQNHLYLYCIVLYCIILYSMWPGIVACLVVYIVVSAEY